jgi:K+ transporter
MVRHHRPVGIWGITKHPAVLLGLDPRYAVSYLAHGGLKGFAVLGGVFLCVTGAEALYADMGHFGAKPIRLAWSARAPYEHPAAPACGHSGTFLAGGSFV